MNHCFLQKSILKLSIAKKLCESYAINELYINYSDILLCKPANPESLVEDILKMKNNIELREKIRENANKKSYNNASSKVVGERSIKILNQILFKYQ